MKIKKVLASVNEITNTVFAYKDRLKPQNIQTFEDFKKLKTSDKSSLYESYSLEQLTWDTACSDVYAYTASSGSTGNPTIWPRSHSLEKKFAVEHMAFLKEHFDCSKKTLVVMLFPVGLNTAGWIHTFWMVEQFNLLKMAVLPISHSDQTIFEKLITSNPIHYEQILVFGFPSVVYKFVDSNRSLLSQFQVGIVYAGEVVTPSWKLQLQECVDGLTEQNIVCLYGATEVGLIGYETADLKKAISSESAQQKIKERFGMVSYSLVCISDAYYTEVLNETLHITAFQPIPLIRYDLQDKALVLSGAELDELLQTSIFSSNSKQYAFIFGRRTSFSLLVEHIKMGLELVNMPRNVVDFFKFEESTVDSKEVLRLWLPTITSFTQKKQATFLTYINSVQSKSIEQLELNTLANDSKSSGKHSYFMKK